ncbi:E3 ubiquitin-protein ligase TM129-like [Engystomops pustulosus]|uniref:E3 ubiquitin-protein ligase TM129-like n=1 Tax=Engystomops pustulosus TaxID=76066 RepID=UPI003AFAE6E5
MESLAGRLHVVFAVCFMFPANEIHSAGITEQKLLSGGLVSENVASSTIMYAGHGCVIGVRTSYTCNYSFRELEPCIGCMQTNANIKLVKYCYVPNKGECQQFYCQPVWCLTCRGKWFKRPEQHHPETCLSSKFLRPSCPARLFIVDVCIIQ